MSFKVGGLCFILLCSFLTASTHVIHENISISSEETISVDEHDRLTLLCNATEVPGATVVWRREDSRNITLRRETRFEIIVNEVISDPNPAIPLVNSDKYVIEERQENEHTTLMQLTVRNVEPADYRTYSCGSTNRLGAFNANRLLHQSRENLK
ncbi:hypothetical protein B566_EDAN014344 [Ephemera danica]|nr:hypothetical protein B566_EDAN014344 [Ephemera danica]